MFDLFFKFEKFDFSKFDVMWLLNWQERIIQTLSENETVKNKVRECIAKEIQLSRLKESDLMKLTMILTKYFC